MERETKAHVVTIHNNTYSTQEFMENVLPLFDAVIVGPGPGHPANDEDVGVIPALWANNEIPVFGVCLGMQSMGLAFGARIERLEHAQHGQPGLVRHNGHELFESIPSEYSSIRYHSLQVVADNLNNAGLDFEVLASCSNSFDNSESIMAIRHKSKPFYGVQYHPESICSEYGDALVRNFWALAQKWWSTEGKSRSRLENDTLLQQLCSHSVQPIPLSRLPLPEQQTTGIFKHAIASKYMTAPDICEILDSQFVLLNSAADPGRYSVIGALVPDETNWIRYQCGTSKVTVQKWKSSSKTVIDIKGDTSSIWEYLSRYMAPKIDAYHSIVEPDLPFVGGLIGYFSYEAGVESLGGSVTSDLPDVNLVDVEKCIVVDNAEKLCHVISLKDDGWLESCVKLLENSLPVTKEETTGSTKLTNKPAVTMPEEDVYSAKITTSKEYLAAGDSYELCLTARTTIGMNDGRYDDPWNLYKTLLVRNPSPYSCFMQFPDATLVGSSPERFISWDRNGVCQFRPIKGTVKKIPGETTRESAEAILQTPKERGENLMIVDLIRHDMHQLTPHVDVTSLMQVEEYKTVFQLVSVIKGQLLNEKSGDSKSECYKGIDVLAHSLPPGSMTGAPKLRSVQILHELEDKEPRGIYSGVCGYWSVTDQGDWSVIIRSAFSYEPRKWNIGAGGAITILSNEQDEWDEMKTKLEAALQAFY